MTEQTIPAEKVRGVINEIDGCLDGTFLNDQARRALEAAKVSIENILPAPPQPTSGLFGKWAKHPEHGDVMCIWGKPDSSGHISVHWAKKGGFNDVEGRLVLLSDLTFPHQANRPAEVQPGEAWRIRDTEGNEFNAVKTSSGYYTTDRSGYTWLFCDHDGNGHWLKNKEVTLISPLTPERPASDLQAKYDALDAKYREAVGKIKTLEQGVTPRIVATEAEYAALPIGSIVSKPDAPHIRHAVFKKIRKNKWERTGDKVRMADRHMAQMVLPVLRYGWGDEQPTWRIEHDWRNLRVGEYIIDQSGDDGTVTKKDEKHGWWLTDSMALGNKTEAPFIAFTNRSAATPEAIAEAKRARDKEMGK